MMTAAIALAKREVVRFLRQRSRVIGALATPIFFWIFIGAGVGRSFQSAALGDNGANFLAYFFPGTVVMILLFTAIFSTISVIDDRKEGFLQGVLVSPASRGAIVLGKLLGGGFLAFAQACLFLLAAPVVGVHFTIAGWAVALGLMAVLAVGLTGLGLMIAWSMSSTQGFHAIMNLVLMPMWFMSGALFPAEGAYGPVRWAMMLNPLTYGLAGLRRALYWNDAAIWGNAPAAAALPAMWVCVVVTIGFAAATFCLSWFVATRPERVGV